MSRRSSFNENVSRVEHTSAPPSTVGSAAASPLLPTRAGPLAPGGSLQQLHSFSPQRELYFDRWQSMHVQSLPAPFPNIDYYATPTPRQNPPAYLIQPASTSFQLSRATRKSKMHVQSACVNCKQAHLSCDSQRPCQRCVRRNLDSTCVDIPHRKRGRPRIREQIPNEAAPFPLDRRKRPSTALPAQGYGQEEQAVGPIPPKSKLHTEHAFKRPSLTLETEPIPPVAFLDMDFRIAQMNDAFQDMFRFLGDLHGQPLERLVDAGAEDSLEALRNIRATQLQERDLKNPSYLPPIRNSDDPGNVDIPQVSVQDLKNICQGYNTIHQPLQFLTKEGRSFVVAVEFCLARTAVIFVTLKLTLIQSPQRATTSHTATSVASTSSANPDTRRSSYTVASQAPDRRRSTASAHSSPTKPYDWIPSSLPPPISPLSPASRQKHALVPEISLSSVKSQSVRAPYPSPFDALMRTDAIRLGSQHLLTTSGPETKPSATSIHPYAHIMSYQIAPYTQVEELKLPPITTLGASPVFRRRTRSSSLTENEVDNNRLQNRHEHQTQHRAAERARRELSREESSHERPASVSEQAVSQRDTTRETRKRKRGLDVSDLTS